MAVYKFELIGALMHYIRKDRPQFTAIQLNMTGLSPCASKFYANQRGRNQVVSSILILKRTCARNNPKRKKFWQKIIEAPTEVTNWFVASIMFTLKQKVREMLPLSYSNQMTAKSYSALLPLPKTHISHLSHPQSTQSKCSFKRLQSITNFKIWSLKPDTAKVHLWFSRSRSLPSR